VAILLLCMLVPVDQNVASHTNRHFGSAFAHSVGVVLTVLPLMVRLMDRGEALLLQFLLDLTKNYAKQKKKLYVETTTFKCHRQEQTV